MRDEIHISLSPGNLPEDMSEETKKYLINLIHELGISLDRLQENMVHSVENMKKEIADIESRLALTELHVRGLGFEGKNG
ncbi:MAG: hypothetical protein KZQ89_13250 [Candidatus Thiodiazotropha sp. (ex Lucinoma kastoroae)]|nr:hypothetical protein [Candidatus Thiodiazotropha sp. (ex Lucinoma kastoroae)]MCU7861925.1 hypothetical protein [Candidatus Thiodiazotropha sp. (ex Lucinoma kastoroae)]